MKHEIPELTFRLEMGEDSKNREPDTLSTALSWAALDTAWNLLREMAVRVVFTQIREAAERKGVEWPATDQEVLERIKVAHDLDKVPSYLDLAVGDPDKLEEQRPEIQMAAGAFQQVLMVLNHEMQHVMDEIHGGTLLETLADNEPPYEGDGFPPEGGA